MNTEENVQAPQLLSPATKSISPDSRPALVIPPPWHRRTLAARSLSTSFVLAAVGTALVLAVNHGDALLRLDLSWDRGLQAGLSFLALVGASAYVRWRRPPNAVPPEGKKSASARIKKTETQMEVCRWASHKT